MLKALTVLTQRVQVMEERKKDPVEIETKRDNRDDSRYHPYKQGKSTPRFTNTFRTTDGVPICRKCLRVGHIEKMCRQGQGPMRNGNNSWKRRDDRSESQKEKSKVPEVSKPSEKKESKAYL